MDMPLLTRRNAPSTEVTMRRAPMATARHSLAPAAEGDETDPAAAAGGSTRLVGHDNMERMQQEEKAELDIDDEAAAKKASLWKRFRGLFRLNKLVYRPYMSVESGGATWEAGFEYTKRTYRSRPAALWLGLAIWVGVTYFGVFMPFGAQSAVGQWNHIHRWWAVLVKPVWVLPTSWFIPVYIIMHFAAALGMWQLWQDGGVFKCVVPTMLYLVQVALASLWADIFFGLKSLGGALAVVVFAWLDVSYMLYEFGRRSRSALLCLIVHWTLVTYGMALSSSLNSLNPPGSVKF